MRRLAGICPALQCPNTPSSIIYSTTRENMDFICYMWNIKMHFQNHISAGGAGSLCPHQKLRRPNESKTKSTTAEYVPYKY